MKQFYFILFFLSTLIIGLNAIYRLSYKADLPFKYHSENNKIISDTSFNEIRKTDHILAINGIPVNSTFETEFLIDTKHIGEEVRLTVMSENDIMSFVNVRLGEYYNDMVFILITLFVGLSYWLTGVYVFIFGKKENASKILSLTLVTFSLAMFTSPCYYGAGDDWMGYLIRISHCASYVFGSIFFLHFTLTFPNKFSVRQMPVIKSLYVLLTIFSIVMCWILCLSIGSNDKNYLDTYSVLWDLTQFILLTSIISGAVLLIFKYRKLTTKNEKAKVEWIFWGLAAGVSPFLFLWLVPSIFGLEFPVREEIILAFLILIPVSFSIAVVKYQLFNIEVVIKRSIIYLSLLVLMMLLYFGFVYGLSSVTGELIGEDSKLFNIIAVGIIALAFNPVRVKLKNYVDVVFYRQNYSINKAVSDLNKSISKCDTIGILGENLMQEIRKLIPVKSIAVCTLTTDGERLRVIAQENFDNMIKYIPALRVKKIFSEFKLPFAVSDKVEKDIDVDLTLEKVFKRWNIGIGIPLLQDPGNVTGIILMGSKLSELKYSPADVELLSIIGSTASLVLKRLELQEQVIKEELEISNLKEINKMKSYFVATVSHDLKTPLSSIKIFSDLLSKENITKEKKQEYLSYVDGETDRLNRMVSNILNFAKIERGIKNYNFRRIEVNSILKKVLKDLSYDLKINKFEVDMNICEEEMFINGDNDDINSLFENLISNSIKYSGDTKYLKIVSLRDDGNAVIIFEDRGIGIPEENLKDIFDPYYRGRKTELSKVKGTGLGLAIVKNVVEAHSGKIEVSSEVSKGSIFKIILPIHNNED